jgi:hypothetical protein
MLLAGKIALSLVGTAVTGVGIICSEGFVDVNVNMRGADPHHIHIAAPALLVPTALHFVPKRDLAQASHELQEWMPTVRVALEELRRIDDMAFVEVKQEGQHVLVKKEGGSIVVDVEDGEDTVHVSTPISTIESSVEQIAAASSADQAH